VDVRELLTDVFGRIEELYADVAGGLDIATLTTSGRVDEASLGQVVDRDWSPPVTTGVRLVSVQGDCLQHLGQAAYLKGLTLMSGD
jgi:hypothetical protein